MMADSERKGEKKRKKGGEGEGKMRWAKKKGAQKRGLKSHPRNRSPGAHVKKGEGKDKRREKKVGVNKSKAKKEEGTEV